MFKNVIARRTQKVIAPLFPRQSGVASQYKISAHGQRIADYLAGKPIYPVTLELDLTSQCNRKCKDCPSTRATNVDSLKSNFIEKLFNLLAGKTPGLLLTGGEPTMGLLFPDTLKLARQKGFKEIAVVTNGSKLDEPAVYSALLEHVSTIRLSLYDFKNASCEGINETLERIERLRKLIDSSKSDLKIGISTLTSSQRIPVLGKISEAVKSAGAHWLYFHPMCSNWGKGAPEMMDQRGVVEEIHRLQQANQGPFDIYYSAERYEINKIEFAGYHGAHFLMIVGADGKNYLGAEVKYHHSFVLTDLNNGLKEGFLFNQRRLAKISGIEGDTYSAIQSRHRGALYSDLLERIKNNDNIVGQISKAKLQFRFPAIL